MYGGTGITPVDLLNRLGIEDDELDLLKTVRKIAAAARKAQSVPSASDSGASGRRKAASAGNAEEEPLGSATKEQARINAVARTQFLERWPSLTTSEVADLLGSTATNRNAPANKLARAGQIFAIHYRGEDFYPAFQFDRATARPKLVIADVLSELQERAGLRGWELAFWFTDGNAWLPDEKTPVDLLDDDPEAVVEAARHEHEIPW